MFFSALGIVHPAGKSSCRAFERRDQWFSLNQSSASRDGGSPITWEQWVAFVIHIAISDKGREKAEIKVV